MPMKRRPMKKAKADSDGENGRSPKRSRSPMKGSKRRRTSSGGDSAEDEPEGSPSRRGSRSPMKRKKTVEQTYQKKTQVEHILLRPDTYVGSVDSQNDSLWVWNEKKKEMEHKEISYVPALYKIFDEILVNAADNLQRDPKMNQIKVDIDPGKGRIRVWNNGKGLPIQIHKKYKILVPELVFGHLLTSDNYDDSEKKVTGGRNGFGAKLTNIFSKKFIVETGNKGKKYKQVWTDNMKKKSNADVKKGGGDYTMVEFYPDLSKFGMNRLDTDIVSLMQRRVYDLAGASGERCGVFLNGKKLPLKNFEDYSSFFIGKEGYASVKVGRRWEVIVAQSDGDGFNQNSFCNSISTPKGGTHVNYIADQVVEALIKRANKVKGKGGPEVKRVHVKNHLWIFINCMIENPAFSSQTKEQMTLKVSKFGSACNLNNSFFQEICDNTGIVDAVVAEAQSKMTVEMDKMTSGGRSSKRLLGVPKLEDANDAGTSSSRHCTLILTEGDSAKALAISGLSVIGRDKYGVFPLRGKLLNVRDGNQKQLIENKEIMSIVKILGLSFDKKNKQENLRYGSVMIMADQDYDGSHIKGLLINFFHYFWPKLLQKNKGFICEFVTPIVKCSRQGKIHQFFTQVEYDKWKKKNDSGKGWQIKYYKGLGTSTAAEAKQYFSDIADHKLVFKWKSGADGKLIDMAFNKGRADDRKKWMNKYKEGTFVDHSKTALSYQEFVNVELVQYSRYDVMRSIPSVMDGLKPGQRKVLFSCFKRNLKSDVKVAQLCGYVAEHSAYHHGESSLANTIVQMAHTFVGSNNIHLLEPSGQFGTRLAGGKDAASARYIYTRLAPLTRLIFSPLDDAVLNYQLEEGQKIEPEFYVPIIPLVLVNGAEGIGTGWATSVPNYDPRDIINNMRAFIKRKKRRKMTPWYRGFSGTIKPSGEKGKWDSLGVWEEKKGYVDITELPLRKWTTDYKEFLQGCLPGSDKRTKFVIQDIREHHTENKVHFQLRMTPQEVKDAKADGGLVENLRLKSSVLTSNMVLFDSTGKIKKYKNEVEIMDEFAKVRLKTYDTRKKYLVNKLTIEKELLANRARFIGMIIAKKLHVNNRPKSDVVRDLKRLKFRRFGDDTPPRTGYEYLLTMQILSLTKERKAELEAMLKHKTDELNKLKKTTIQKMWENDLDALESAVNGYMSDMAKVSGKKLSEKEKKKGKKRARPAKGKRRGKKGQDDEDDDDEEEARPAEGQQGADGAEAAPETSGSNLLADVARWTAGMIKAPGDSGKRRRR